MSLRLQLLKFDCIIPPYGNFWKENWSSTPRGWKCIKKSMVWTSRMGFSLREIITLSQEIVCNSLNESYFLMSLNFPFLDWSISRTDAYGVWNVQVKFIKVLTTGSRLWFGMPYRKNKNFGHISSKTGMWQERLTKCFFGTRRSQNFGSTQKTKVYSNTEPLCTYSVFRIRSWTWSTLPIWCAELVPFHGLPANCVWRSLTTFY